MTGQTISHYRVLEPLGEGGTAIVYRAEDLALGREVVLKFLSAEGADYGSIARFQHEARTASSLNHPNICTIYEIGEHQGRHFLVMEHLEGDVLSRMLVGRPIDTSRIVDVMTQVADALDAAHAQGIVHRDIKPANIFVTKRGQVKLLDFGLAVLMPRKTKGQLMAGATPSSTGGTVPYMSPEQTRADEIDHRTDLFSFGVVMYEMGTGRRPFAGATAGEVMDAIVTQPPVPPRDLNPAMPSELARIIEKALEKNPRLRFQTASDIRADLQRMRRDLDSVVRLPPRRPLAASLSSPRRRIAAVVGGMALGGGVLLALAMPKQQPPIAPAAELGLLPATRTQAATATIEPPKPTGMQRAASGVAATVASVPAPPAAPSLLSREESAPHSPVAAASIDARPLVPADKELPPGRPTEDLRIAREKIALKLYDPALDTLRRIVAQTTNRDEAIDAFFLIASVHETRGEMDHAMSTYLEVSRRFPDAPRAAEALLDLAQATLKSKRHDKDVDARRVLSEVVQKYPASAAAPRALLLRGEIEERQGLYQRDEELGGSIPTAVLSYRAVVERYGSSAASTLALAKLGRIYADTKRFESATVVLEQLAERDRDNAYDAWFTAAEIYDKRLKDPKRAKAAYERVPASSPHYADAQKRLRK